MKALAIRQPWAWAILHAGKDIENREWKPNNPNLRFRGRFVVHASAEPPVSRWNEEWHDYCAFICERFDAPDAIDAIPLPEQMQFGALIGTVEVVQVVHVSPSKWFSGPLGLLLREPRSFTTPIPFKGALGFFDVPDGILPHA